MMSRKDYDAVARAIVSSRWGGLYDAMADNVAHHLADELAPLNPRFDRARFLAACRRDPVMEPRPDERYG